MKKNGKKINKGRAIAAFIANIVVNSIFKSLVGAVRDKKEDETYWEKFFRRMLGDLVGSKQAGYLDGAWSPFTMVPWVKDIISLVAGYNVDRADVSVAADMIGIAQEIIRSVKDYDGKFDWNETELLVELAGALGAFAGVPVGRMLQDAYGITRNIVNRIQHPKSMTWETWRQAIIEGLGFDRSKAEKAYEAIMRNNTEYITRQTQADENKIDAYMAAGYTFSQAREQAGYDALKSWYQQVKNGVLAKDERVSAAANARYEEDYTTYENLVNAMTEDGLPEYAVLGAIESLFGDMLPEEIEVKGISEKDLYKTDDLDNALQQDDPQAFRELTARMVAMGKKEENIIKHAADFAEAEWEKTADRDKVKHILTAFAGYSDSEANKKIENWRYNELHPDGSLNATAYATYYDKVKPSGISVEVYEEYWKADNAAEGEDKNGDGKTDTGTKKAEQLKIIDSLPITSEQKDVLYRLHSSWAESKLSEAPWHK